MLESILISIKKMLGIEADYDAFDTDIIIHINTVFMTLQQLGVGPESGFRITGKDETWSMFLNDLKHLEAVKTFVYIKVKLAFDPPTSSFVLASLERQAGELEWRLNVQAESKQTMDSKIITFEEIDEMFE